MSKIRDDDDVVMMATAGDGDGARSINPLTHLCCTNNGQKLGIHVEVNNILCLSFRECRYIQRYIRTSYYVTKGRTEMPTSLCARLGTTSYASFHV